MVMGRMVWNYTSSAKVLGITAWNFTKIFVVLDIMYVRVLSFLSAILTRRSAFAIQVYGAAATQTPDISRSEILHGRGINEIGVTSD